MKKKIDIIKKANRLWNNNIVMVKNYLIVPINQDRLNELNIKGEQQYDHLTESLIQPLETGNDECKTFLNRFDLFLNDSKIKLNNFENKNKNFI
jgi:hypothetical protein